MATQITYLILPHVHLLDLAGADQVFFEANDYGANLSLQYCSLARGLHTSASLPIGRLQHFQKVKLQPGDFLFIPGSSVEYLMSPEFAAEHELFLWLRERHASGVRICSVCTGAFVLGKAGLLNGRKCTTHWKRTDELKRAFPQIRLEEDILFAEDGGIFTSAGVTAGIDMALHILEMIVNEQMAFKVARELVVYMRRDGANSQHSVFLKYRNHIHSGIHKAQDYLQDNLSKKVSLEELADTACMSSRSLTRTFRRETGISVNEYTTLLRQERLKEFMKNPRMSRKQMAHECGLQSERQVLRLLKAEPPRI
ncbi:MAG: DJ-1/PfpI family protein [Chryseolinea sp.]